MIARSGAGPIGIIVSKFISDPDDNPVAFVIHANEYATSRVANCLTNGLFRDATAMNIRPYVAV